jgi:hypothetical protein
MHGFITPAKQELRGGSAGAALAGDHPAAGVQLGRAPSGVLPPRSVLLLVPCDLGTDSSATGARSGPEMTTGAAGIAPNAGGQRRQSVPDGKNAPSRARGPGLGDSLSGSDGARDAQNPFAEESGRGRIVSGADDGRQRTVKWEMSDENTHLCLPRCRRRDDW